MESLMWFGDVMWSTFECPSCSLDDVLLNCSKPALDDKVGVSHIMVVIVFFFLFFLNKLPFVFLLCYLASTNWPTSVGRFDEERPCPHVPFLLILHFLLILRLFHSGLWFGNQFLHFFSHFAHGIITCYFFPFRPKMFELLPSIQIPPRAWHVWFTSDVAKITLVSVKMLVYCRSEIVNLKVWNVSMNRSDQSASLFILIILYYKPVWFT